MKNLFNKYKGVHTMKIFLNNLVLCISLVFICCSPTTPGEENTEEENLQNTLWILEAVETEGEIVDPPQGQIYTIKFQTDTTIRGKNDCNELFAQYTILLGDLLQIDQLVTTKKGCGGDQDYSEKFIQALANTKSYKIKKISFLSIMKRDHN